MMQSRQDKVQWTAWLLWAISASFFLLEYFVRVSPSVMIQQLMNQFNIGAFTIGWLFACFYVPYDLLQIPAGRCVDKYSVKKIICTMAFLCAIACLMFAYANSIYMLFIARITMGITASFAFVGALKIATLYLPFRYIGMIAGMTQALGMLGAATGEGPLAIVMAHTSWNTVLVFIAMALLMVMVLLYLVPTPKVIYNKASEKEKVHYSIWKSIGYLVRHKTTLYNALSIGFMYAPTAAFAESWGSYFIQHTHHISMKQSAEAISLVFIGLSMGAPILGYLADCLDRYLLTMRVAAVLSGLLITVVIFVPLSYKVMCVVLFCYGFFNGGIVLGYARASKLHAASITGMSIAFANMMSVVIGTLLQPVLGGILSLLSGPESHHGVMHYPVGDMRLAFILLPVSAIISVVFLFLQRERGGDKFSR